MITPVHVLSALILGGAALAAPAQAATVYSNDFESSSTAGFSSGGVLTTAPGNGQKYLGQLTLGSHADLTVNGLVPHTAVNLTFDLYSINSLDGDGTSFCCGPDSFKLTFNSATLLDNTFTNNTGWTQNYGGAGSPGGTGSDAGLTGVLGYSSFGPDHTYHLSFNNLDLGSNNSALLSFIGNANQDWNDEGFGIDNVVVTGTVATTPIPATAPLFLTGLTAIGWMTRRRKAAAKSA